MAQFPCFLGFGVLSMRGRFVFWLFCLCHAAASGGPALAGAFLQRDGAWQIITTSVFTGSLHSFDAKGRLIPIDTYTKYELGAYIEYGAADWITLILQPTAARVYKEGPPAGVYLGLGSVEAGARISLGGYEGVVFSAQAVAHVPGGRDRNNPALIGNTGYELDLRGLAAMPFEIGGFTGYFDAQVGYRIRRGGPPGEMRADFTLGFRPLRKWLLLAQSFNIYAPTAGKPGFPPMRQHKFQASAVWDFSASTSFQSGVFTTIAGRRARQEYGMISGIWYRF